MRHLFPYINAALDEAVYYEKPEHVSFLFHGYRCFLYPNLAAAHFFESKMAAKDFIVCLIDFLNDIYNQKENIRPNYDQIKQIPIIDILKILPKTNCQKCGYLTCMAFAAAIIKGKSAADKCPSLASPINENAVYPIFDNNGNVVNSVSLRINTSKLKNRIQEQQEQILMLEASLKTNKQNEEQNDSPRKSEKNNFGLTNREIEVLKLIAEGYTNNEISGILFISPHTVKSHMINIFNKLSVNDRTQAAVLAIQNDII
ncbi:LuxR C-terminal-related transcriptional regulator [Desulfobacula sp.]|uniref:LuxR C-terminal-related transcriptional regulator n=1 Tax=Desulfobacula sp. TaxID=2593537 RepID=UPI0025BF9F23|nr:LuxR C-terminal-related transcriptional regulator [Desulfobacula sp.]